jgi:hypothetical protein
MTMHHRSSVIDVFGTFVGAAIQRNEQFRFIAIDQRVQDLDGIEFATLQQVQSAATQRYLGDSQRAPARLLA